MLCESYLKQVGNLSDDSVNVLVNSYGGRQVGTGSYSQHHSKNRPMRIQEHSLQQTGTGHKGAVSTGSEGRDIC